MLVADLNALLAQASCSKKAFARLIGKDASTISRWGSTGPHALPVPKYAQVVLHALIMLDKYERHKLLQRFARGNE